MSKLDTTHGHGVARGTKRAASFLRRNAGVWCAVACWSRAARAGVRARTERRKEKKSKEVSNDTLRRQRVSRMRTLPTVQFCLSTALEGTLELTGCHSTKMREAGSHGRLYLTSRGQTHQAGSSSR